MRILELRTAAVPIEYGHVVRDNAVIVGSDAARRGHRRIRRQGPEVAWKALGPDGQFQWRLAQTAIGPHAELLCITARHADRDGNGFVCQWGAFDGPEAGAGLVPICRRPGADSEAELLADLAADWGEAANCYRHYTHRRRHQSYLVGVR